MKLAQTLILSVSFLLFSCSDSDKRYETLIRSGGDDIVIGTNTSHDPAHRMDNVDDRIIVMGDVGYGSRAQRQLSGLISDWNNRDEIAAVLLLGDNINNNDPYDSSSEEELFRPMREIFEAEIPVHTILGNHCHQNGYAKSLINDDRLGMRGNQYYRLMDDEGLYSIYMLDSEVLEQDIVQQQWLKETLATDTSKWIVCALHITPYGTKEIGHEGSRRMARILEEADKESKSIDIILSAHNHIYERRFVPSMNAHAIVQGSSGRNDSFEYWPNDPNRIIKYDEMESFLMLKFNENLVTGLVVNSEGETVDFFSIGKPEENEHRYDQANADS